MGFLIGWWIYANKMGVSPEFRAPIFWFKLCHLHDIISNLSSGGTHICICSSWHSVEIVLDLWMMCTTDLSRYYIHFLKKLGYFIITHIFILQWMVQCFLFLKKNNTLEMQLSFIPWENNDASSSLAQEKLVLCYHQQILDGALWGVFETADHIRECIT